MARIAVPYFRQSDNVSGTGWRECASSCSAMVAAFYGRVSSDDEYNRLRQRFGDTTSIEAQTQTLRSLGLVVGFTMLADWPRVERAIRAGRPVILPYLHRGPVTAPAGGGHWAVCIGLQPEHLIIHDPMAEPDLIRGGHIPGTSGQAVRCTRRNFGRRWMLEGPGSGWLLTAHP